MDEAAERILPLIELKERTRVVTAVVRDASDAERRRLAAGFATVLKTDVWGEQTRIVGRDLEPEFEAKIRAEFGDRLLSLEISTPNLEEIFVAAMTQPLK